MTDNKREDDTLDKILAGIVVPNRRVIQEIITVQCDAACSSEPPAYGGFDKAEDFLEAFDQLVEVSTNQQEALDIIVNRPRDLTRKGLIELQEWFDSQNFNDASLRSAWKVAKNQDIAAKLIGHIRRASIGDALLPFDERVDLALNKIKAANEWNEEQINWLERLAASIKDKVVLDEDTFKTGNYRRKGGKRKLMNVFNDELDTILSQFNQFMWDEPA
ncbi:hypothetical protein ND928_14370 [Vibrio diabolicus]|nr:hypothetical protein [Vibrio diabolicus]